MDKTGSFIGYMFVPVEKGGWRNLSEMLLENGLATVHFTAERSLYYNQLTNAEKSAKESKLNIWKSYVETPQEEDKRNQANDTTERKLNYKKVLATEIYPGLRFAAQSFDDGKYYYFYKKRQIY
jgi:staphylococcal nuclease domain-containing protein 1